MHRRLTPGLALLRATGLAALLILIWNPIAMRRLPGAAPPLVLLDASLSMTGHGGRWREALDSARALGSGGGVIWRFGDAVAAFDSTPPAYGASRLEPALAAAAARGGPVAVVTDGELADVASLAPDLRRAPRVVVLPRPPFWDAFVAAVDGPRRVAQTDTIRLTVSYGTAGNRETGNGKRAATIAVVDQGRRLAARDVSLPDSGIVSTELAFPVSRFPSPGWSTLEVRLEGVRDSEPRDDARRLVVEVSSAPAVVVLAAPPDWDLRFLARTLAEVARVPLKMFVAPEAVSGGGSRWRDATTLAPVGSDIVRRAVSGARLVVEGGDPAALGRLSGPSAVLRWHTAAGQEGDWYVDAPPASPLSAALAGVAWDSLPPVAALAVPSPAPDSATVVALTARLARRGRARPVLVLSEGGGGGARRADIAAGGLYRWAFRGGASTEAYRAVVAALADWLLEGEGGRGKGERAVPEARVVANGFPVVWRWTGSGAPRDLVATLAAGNVARRDTLRFDASGRSELRLPPGVYRYALARGAERGIVAVETYSDEWRPAPPQLHAQTGAPAGRLETVGARDRWWLFALVVAALTAEWAWRRRQGLP